MLTQIKKWINQNHLLQKGDKVLAACSGGPDSLALVSILHHLKDEYELTLAVAHVDHMFRGAESAADAAFVAEMCKKLSIPCFQTAIDVPRYIAETGKSPQDAARILRYQYLRQVAHTMGNGKIATGHHRDDQAETVLIHLLRGAGGSGIGGMKACDAGIIRPLLDVSRSQIEQYCRDNDLSPRLDSTNLQTKYRRNKIRIELIPLLEREYNVNISDAICRTAILIGDEHNYVAEAANNTWPSIGQEENKLVTLNCERLNCLHIALKREIIRRAVEKIRGDLKGITFYHVEKLIELANCGQVGSLVELPGGIIARRNYTKVSFCVQEPASPKSAASLEVPLSVPGVTPIPKMGITITASLQDKNAGLRSKNTAVFDWQEITTPLYVRLRKAGDRFQPLGMSGNKKLKDFFIDAKIPQEERDSVPIICDDRGILWIGGYRQTDRGKVTEKTTHFLQLTIQNQEAFSND
jgi:tRNA(Ile)-lysidine synthase